MDNILLIPLAACAILLTVLRPAVVAAAILALLPTYLLRFSVGPLPTTVLEVLLLSFLAVRVTQSIRARTLPVLPRHWLVLGGAFLVAGTLAILPSPDLRAALGLWRAYIVEPVLFAWCSVGLLQTRAHRRMFLGAFGVLALIVAVSVILQLVGALGVPEPYASEAPRRLTGVFPFPTAVGKLLAPLVALFGALLLVRQGSNVHVAFRTAAALVVFAGTSAIVFSVSRGALLGLTAALIVTIILRWGARAGIALAAVLALALITFAPLRTEVQNVVSGRDVSADVHRVLWRGTLRLLAARPLFGAGLAGFPLVYPEYKEASHTEFFPNPDHLFLTAWAEMGFAGLLVWLALLGTALHRSLLHRAAVHADDRALAFGIVAAVVAIIVHGFVDTPYFKNDLAIQFWALMALLAALDGTGQKREKTV